MPAKTSIVEIGCKIVLSKLKLSLYFDVSL